MRLPKNTPKVSQQDGFVPIAEALADLPGPLKALTRSSPQALHHFTVADQVDRLIEAREADPDLGFMARLLALCSLPRTNPGKQLRYKRTNGPYTLYMIAGGGNQLPYGILPRLLLAWVCTEAVRTQSRELSLGRSLYEFINKLGLSPGGGSTGTRTRLRNQMKRLFGCTVSLIYEEKGIEKRVSSYVADRTTLWWDPKSPHEPMLWESKIRLGEAFFQEVISHPVPLDMNILKAMKRSSLGVDLYLWVAYRTFSLDKPLRLRWKRIYRQFGAAPEKVNEKRIIQNFRAKVLREIAKIKQAWPELNYSTDKGVLILSPSKPATSSPTDSLRLVE